MNLIRENIDDLKLLCIKHHVGRLFVFGSLVDNSMKSDSDIDFLVSFKKIKLKDYADNYFELKFSLEDLFQKEIDLLEEKAITNPYLLASINSAKQIVYEA